MITPLTPDNGIVFVDNARMIKNPVGMKTPPPPMWGDEETEYDDDGEPFYD